MIRRFDDSRLPSAGQPGAGDPRSAIRYWPGMRCEPTYWRQLSKVATVDALLHSDPIFSSVEAFMRRLSPLGFLSLTTLFCAAIFAGCGDNLAKMTPFGGTGGRGTGGSGTGGRGGAGGVGGIGGVGGLGGA